MSDTTHPPFPSADNERDPQLPDVPDSLSEEQYDQYTSLYDDPPSTENRVVSMYLSRAQARDSALVEKWTSEMDSILFVATLFSAVVIASLIDHQSQLRRDPTDTTNALLSSISLQLTQLGNGSSQQPFNLDAWSRSHRVRPLNYAVGAFWWTSLFTSLFSSALALFVKQWSRHYLEKTTAPRSLWDRVAASSFLHAGLEDSMMRQLVELIPALFHLSMFFYFLGASMQQSDDQRHIIPPLFIPIALYLVLYAALTLNPLINPRSPISTPLSPVFWKLRLWFSCCIGYRAEETLALKQARLIRNGADQNVLGAVQWTLKSISNDAEAAEFLEGIPGFLRQYERGNAFPLQALMETRGQFIWSHIQRSLRAFAGNWESSPAMDTQSILPVLRATLSMVEVLGTSPPGPAWVSDTVAHEAFAGVFAELKRPALLHSPDATVQAYAYLSHTWLALSTMQHATSTSTAAATSARAALTGATTTATLPRLLHSLARAPVLPPLRTLLATFSALRDVVPRVAPPDADLPGAALAALQTLTALAQTRHFVLDEPAESSALQLVRRWLAPDAPAHLAAARALAAQYERAAQMCRGLAPDYAPAFPRAWERVAPVAPAAALRAHLESPDVFIMSAKPAAPSPSGSSFASSEVPASSPVPRPGTPVWYGARVPAQAPLRASPRARGFFDASAPLEEGRSQSAPPFPEPGTDTETTAFMQSGDIQERNATRSSQLQSPWSFTLTAAATQGSHDMLVHSPAPGLEVQPSPTESGPSDGGVHMLGSSGDEEYAQDALVLRVVRRPSAQATVEEGAAYLEAGVRRLASVNGSAQRGAGS